MILSAWSYIRIPLPRRVRSLMSDPVPISRALAESWTVFTRDRRFFRYQRAFFASGFGNLLSLGLVAEVLREHLQAPAWTIGMVVAFLPFLLKPLSAPLWGRLLDRITPMTARALFSCFMVATYSLYCYGGSALLLWPFLLGSVLQGASQSGTQINWTTGSLYFAPNRRVLSVQQPARRADGCPRVTRSAHRGLAFRSHGLGIVGLRPFRSLGIGGNGGNDAAGGKPIQIHPYAIIRRGGYRSRFEEDCLGRQNT